MFVLSLFEDRSQSVSDRLSTIDLYLTATTSVRAQVICGARGSLIAAQSSEAALFVSGSVKGKQVCVVSWECGGGGGLNPLIITPTGKNDGYKVAWGNLEQNLLFRISHSDELHRTSENVSIHGIHPAQSQCGR